MARARGPRAAAAGAGALLAALALAGGALSAGGALATAEECAPLRKRACSKSATCRWGGEGIGCAVATDACDAVQGRRMRKKCAAVSSMRCECSLSPEKKRGKCGLCAESLVGAPPPGCLPAGAICSAQPGSEPCCDGKACLGVIS